LQQMFRPVYIMASPMVHFTLIFDCDGVLVDSEPLACAVQVEQLARAGLVISADEVARRYTGLSTSDMRNAIEREFGRPLPQDHEARLAEALTAIFERDLRAIAGIPWLVERLSARGVTCAVASSSSPQRLELALRTVGLWESFAPHVFSSSLVARGKPFPDLFLYVAQALRADPDTTLVIEDSVPGIRAARGAGMRAIGFCGGSHCGKHHKQSLLEAGAHHVCEETTSLGALIGDMLRL
jgi:HAD superfamily hydrolase (TIGR01509 family)